MTTHRCVKCDRHFDSDIALEQHARDSHHSAPVAGKKKQPIKLYGLAALIIIVALAYFLYPKTTVPAAGLVEHIKGNPNGTLKIVEYSDFQCPACGAAYQPAKNLVNTYSDKIRFSYKHFPLNSIHPFAQKAGEASECASEQGKFWEYHDKLFENQQSLPVSSLKKYAADLDLDISAFNKCLDSGQMSGRVNSDAASGQSLGVDATPTFFVNGEKLVGSITADRIRPIAARFGVEI